VQLKVPSKLSADSLVDPEILSRVRRGRRFRSVGWFGVLLSIAVFAVRELSSLPGKETSYGLLALGVTVSLLLINWTRIWVQESKEPFQYSFSVGNFLPGPGSDPESPLPGSTLDWLSRDLVEKLSDRVKRLSLLQDSAVPPADPDGDPPAHVHICGWYGVRQSEDHSMILEVVPEVRLGGEGSPAKLAQTVRYRLRDHPSDDSSPVRLQGPDYSRLFERVYWSVASQIYAQIRRGVDKKVRLLPPGRLRAAAYLAEADDYATSNTLDAYAAARELYRRAQEIYDVRSRQERGTAWRRSMAKVVIALDDLRSLARRFFAKVFRKMGRREVLAARAQHGYAWMLVAEYHLRRLSGTVPQGIFEAVPNVEMAIRRLLRTPPDVEGRQDVLFRAMTTLATACSYLGDQRGGWKALMAAEALRPATARDDPEFLLAAGLLELEPVRSLRFMAEAVEVAPQMERAHAHRAQMYEELWRSRESLERDVARVIVGEYAKVIAVNPGNLAAWANRGFIAWLLSDPFEPKALEDQHETEEWREIAINSFEAGREYKEVRGDAMVAELDWNLTRIAAERGRFDLAYRHYVEAVSAMLGEPRLAFLDYFYKAANRELVERFEKYRKCVVQHARSATAEPRLVRSVLAFVLNDCGAANHAYYRRSGSSIALDQARRYYEEAEEKNPDFVLPSFNLAIVELELAWGASAEDLRLAHLKRASARLDKILRREPDWASAQLAILDVQIELLNWAGGKRSEVQGQAKASRTSARFIPGEAVDARREADPVLRKAELDHLSLQARRTAEEILSSLLPQTSLRVKGSADGGLDVFGVDTEALVKDQRSRWVHDYNEIQVVALTSWAKLISPFSAEATLKICSELLGAFYPVDLSLLQLQQQAAERVEQSTSELGTPARRDSIAQIDELVRARLRQEPAHFLFLRDSVLLPREEQLAVLGRAMSLTPPVTTQVWIARRLVELKSLARAMEACKAAVGQPAANGDADDWYFVGRIAEELGDAGTALSAYQRAARSKAGDPSPNTISAAATQAAAILNAEGRGVDAAAELKRAGARHEVAFDLASVRMEQNQPDEAEAIFRRLLEQRSLPAATRARAKVALAELALTLREDREGAVNELEAAVAVESEVRHEALLRLAELHRESNASRAIELYRQALEEGVPETGFSAAQALLSLVDAPQREEVCLIAGIIDPWISLKLGDELLGKGEDELARTAYSAGIGYGRPARPWTGDVRLRLADFFRDRGDSSSAHGLYRGAVESGDLRVAPDAAIAIIEMLATEGSDHEIEHVYPGLVESAGNLDEADPGFAIGFFRELGERLDALGERVRSAELRRTIAYRRPDLAGPLALALETNGDDDAARRIRAALGVAGGPYHLRVPAPRLTPLAAASLHVGKPERILQIECHDGEAALLLAREFPEARVRGIDRSAQAIRHATSRIGLDPDGKIAFKQGDPRQLPFPADQFELLSAVDAWPGPTEAARVLRPGGFLVLTATAAPEVLGGFRGSLFRRRLARLGFEPIWSEAAGDGSFFIARLRDGGAPGSAL
jgi:tetratricopeptide (TPR) repeat protein